MRNLFLLALICFVLRAAFAESPSFDRYRSIVDRQMFGDPPPGFDPTKMPSEVAKTSSKAGAELSAEQEKVKKAIKFSVLNVTSAGETVVGFSDNSDPKNPLHYYLKVGESQNGWTVKEADPEAATMTVVKDDIEVTLKLGGESVEASSTAKKSDATRNSNSLLRTNGLSNRELRKQREAQLREDLAKREEADKARAAQEEEDRKNREAERAEQREQLLRIQEELRKAREAREAQKEESAEMSPEE